MADGVSSSSSSGRRVLTAENVEHINEKVAEAIEAGYAIVELVIEKGRLEWIRGPARSERIRK